VIEQLLSRGYRRIALAALTALSGLVVLTHAPPASAVDIRFADRTSYVLLAAGGQNTTMSGSTDDLKRARALRVGREGLLYVRRGGGAWVIRDSATLRSAGAIFAPQEALGARQAELGQRQAALGERQAALGVEQGRIGLRQASASASLDRELERRQLELGRQQAALGQQQEALGRRQSALGREQERLAGEADSKFHALLADALRRGVARRVD
jgi:hypothetical protein